MDFPLWLRVTHLLNFLLLGLLIRSGWEILSSHPRLYWRNDCGPGTEWLHFTRRRVPPEEGAYMARDDECSLSPVISLPGRTNIGIARHWHALVTTLWVLTGATYYVLLFATGAWRHLVPQSWDVVPHAWDSLTTYLTLQVPPESAFTPYDALQQIMYSVVVFVAAPAMILTGPAMSPAVVGRFPWYARLFGGRQAARSLHFLGMAFLTGFLVVHVVLVFVVHPRSNLVHMMLGSDDTSRWPLGLLVAVVGILAVVGCWLAASYWSLADLRRAQVVLVRLGEPIRRLTVNHLSSRQRSAHVWTERDISPYHWSNGRYPTPEESPDWERLREDDWEGYRLVAGGGLSQTRLELSLEDLRALPGQTQITLHTCMQGWTGIAKWGGVRLSTVLDLLGPRPEGARYVKLTSMGLAQKMADGRPLEPYYTCLPLDLAMEEETILAFDMNDRPLPLTFGAPLRLRCESIHGYKMVKYLASVEWVADYRTEGDGQGGTREDASYQAINARI